MNKFGLLLGALLLTSTAPMYAERGDDGQRHQPTGRIRTAQGVAGD